MVPSLRAAQLERERADRVAQQLVGGDHPVVARRGGERERRRPGDQRAVEVEERGARPELGDADVLAHIDRPCVFAVSGRLASWRWRTVATRRGREHVPMRFGTPADRRIGCCGIPRGELGVEVRLQAVRIVSSSGRSVVASGARRATTTYSPRGSPMSIVAERAAHDLLVELGELAGDGDRPIGAARLRRGRRACAGCGAAPRTSRSCGARRRSRPGVRRVRARSVAGSLRTRSATSAAR